MKILLQWQVFSKLPCIPGGAGLLDLVRVLILIPTCFSFPFVDWDCSSSLADSVAESKV